MCKECKCGKNCTCNCKEDEPLIVLFENEETGALERYEFLEEFKYNDENLMAVTLVGGIGKVEFVTCNEEDEYADFIEDCELEEYFSNLHKADEKYGNYEELILTNENGENISVVVINEFEVNDKKVYVVYVGATEEGIMISFIKQKDDDSFYEVSDQNEFESLSDIFMYILNENDEE